MDGAPRFTVTTRTRRVTVEVTDDGTHTVDGGRAVVQPDGTIEVTGDRERSNEIVLRCPAGSHISVGTASGSVRTSGPLGDVRVVTISGTIRVDAAQRVDLRTVSGSVGVRQCAGECRLVTVSGKVEVGSAGSVEIASQSGRVTGDEVGGGRVRTVSSTVRVGYGFAPHASGVLSVVSTSGGVHIRVPTGRRPATRLHSRFGRISSAVRDGTDEDGSIEVHTTSGAIRVDQA